MPRARKPSRPSSQPVNRKRSLKRQLQRQERQRAEMKNRGADMASVNRQDRAIAETRAALHREEQAEKAKRDAAEIVRRRRARDGFERLVADCSEFSEWHRRAGLVVRDCWSIQARGGSLTAWRDLEAAPVTGACPTDGWAKGQPVRRDCVTGDVVTRDLPPGFKPKVRASRRAPGDGGMAAAVEQLIWAREGVDRFADGIGNRALAMAAARIVVEGASLRHEVEVMGGRKDVSRRAIRDAVRCGVEAVGNWAGVEL